MNRTRALSLIYSPLTSYNQEGMQIICEISDNLVSKITIFCEV